METTPKSSIKFPLGLAIGFLIGLLALAAVRFISYKNPAVHYHANFAVYINGIREEFKDPSYYEEISACSTDFDRPQHRAHLHDNVNDVVHVHDEAVTWGDLFSNIGWSVGSTFIATPTKLYTDSDEGHLMLMLNGQSVANIANKVIGDKDHLLISYGKMDAHELQTQIDSVAKTAEQVDKAADPATCSGPETSGWRARLNNVLR